jgi:hypothetical protein
MTKKKARGSRFVIQKKQLSDEKLVLSIPFEQITVFRVIESVFAIARSIFQEDGSLSEAIFYRSDIEEYFKNIPSPLSANYIRKVVPNICKLGIFTEQKIPTDTPPYRINQYALASSKSISQIKHQQSQAEQVVKLTKRMTKKQKQLYATKMININELKTASSLALWTHSLVPVLRHSTMDSRKVINGETSIAGVSVSVVTSSKTNSEIMHLDDLMTVRALITLCKEDLRERINNQLELENRFFFHITQLTRLMGYSEPSSGSAITTALSSFQRIRSTSFDINLSKLPPVTRREIFESLNLDADGHEFDFRLINECIARFDSETDQTESAAREFSISLHSIAFAGLREQIERQYFQDHRSVLTYRDGMLQALYSFFNLHVLDIPVEFTLFDLYEMYPGLATRDFAVRLLRGLIRYAIHVGVDIGHHYDDLRLAGIKELTKIGFSTVFFEWYQVELIPNSEFYFSLHVRRTELHPEFSSTVIEHAPTIAVERKQGINTNEWTNNALVDLKSKLGIPQSTWSQLKQEVTKLEAEQQMFSDEAKICCALYTMQLLNEKEEQGTLSSKGKYNYLIKAYLNNLGNRALGFATGKPNASVCSVINRLEHKYQNSDLDGKNSPPLSFS